MSGPKRVDHTGRVLGKWTVLDFVGGKPSRWKCRCDCGAIKNVLTSHIASENTFSCGCRWENDRSPPEPTAVANAKWVSLGKGRFSLIDAEDEAAATQWKWTLSAQGYAISDIQTFEGKKNIRLHNFVVGGLDVDHISGDRLDNRKANLRAATGSGQACNKKKTKANISGFKGVSLEKKSGRWLAQIVVEGKKTWLGRHATAEEAAKAYDTAAREKHGAFARLNFPQPGEQHA